MLGASLLLAGCVQPLAVQDPFMNPFNSTANGIGQRVSGLMAEGRARQAAGRACNRMPRQICPPEPAVAPETGPAGAQGAGGMGGGRAGEPVRRARGSAVVPLPVESSTKRRRIVRRLVLVP